MAPYLDDCIRSVLKQSYRELEIILVDDGSTDNSSQICDMYGESDNRVRVIHKTNGGLSSARNEGLKVAKGEYISFVDSDDWLELNFYEVLYRALEENNADISVCGRYLASEHAKIEMYCADTCILLSRKEALSQIFKLGVLDVAAWDKLYRRDVLQNICFPEGEINEDTAVIYDIFDRVGTVVHIGKPLYNYRIRSGSITKSGYSEKFDVVLAHINQLYADVQKGDPELVDDLSIYVTHLCYNMLVKIIRSQNKKYYKQYNDYFMIFKKGWLSYCRSNKVTADNKIRCILVRIHLFGIFHQFSRFLKR